MTKHSSIQFGNVHMHMIIVRDITQFHQNNDFPFNSMVIPKQVWIIIKFIKL